MVTPNNNNVNKKTSSSIMTTEKDAWKNLKSKLTQHHQQQQQQQQQKITPIITHNNNITMNMDPSPNNKMIENDNISSLQALKEKFMPSTEMSILLPWEQYRTMTTTTTLIDQMHSSNNNTYDDMIQDINVSYARVSSANFETLNITEADKLVKKFCQLKQTLESMYEKIKLNTDTIRATVKALKLNMPHSTDIFQLNEYTSQIKWLLDEFYFTSKYVHHLETKYLQHLAGTLYNGSKEEKKKDNTSVYLKQEEFTLTDILQRLRDIFDDDNESLSNISSPHSSSSSISLTSSVSSATSSSLSSRTTIQVVRHSTTNTNSLLLQDIYTAIDKVSSKFKQNLQEEKKLETWKELAKQRERSAELVLQLEKNRFLTTQKHDAKCQTLQGCVTALEQELAKKDEIMTEQKLEIETLVKEKNTLENEKKKWLEMEKRMMTEQKLEIETLKHQLVKVNTLENDKKEWLEMEKRIIDQCSTIVDATDKSDIESIVTQLVLQDKELKSSLEKVQKTYNEKKQAEVLDQKFPAVVDKNLLITQQKLIHLQNRFDQAIKTYTTRESAYILQSASTEAELGRILKEYDRLTRNIIDFNHERKKFETELQDLYKENSKLSKLLSDEKILNIPGGDSMLRKEFRNLMSSVKSRHEKDMLNEINARRKVEHVLREKVSEIEMKRWEKVDTAVQTYMQLPFM